MGIKYDDAVIVYNRFLKGTLETEYYVGRRYDNVRIELTQGANISNSGLESASSIRVKIPKDEVANYVPPAVWGKMDLDEKLDSDTFAPDCIVIIVKKKELNIDYDLELPTGLIRSDDYAKGFFNYLKNEFGYTFDIKTVDIFQLIPRYELGGN